jgi:hypothetical protein
MIITVGVCYTTLMAAELSMRVKCLFSWVVYACSWCLWLKSASWKKVAIAWLPLPTTTRISRWVLCKPKISDMKLFINPLAKYMRCELTRWKTPKTHYNIAEVWKVSKPKQIGNLNIAIRIFLGSALRALPNRRNHQTKNEQNFQRSTI